MRCFPAPALGCDTETTTVAGRCKGCLGCEPLHKPGSSVQDKDRVCVTVKEGPIMGCPPWGAVLVYDNLTWGLVVPILQRRRLSLRLSRQEAILELRPGLRGSKA